MKVAIASDHAGFEMKEALKEAFPEYDWLDLGTDGPDSVSYADYGHAMGEAMSEGKAVCGIVICGSGIGISIAANRHAKVRAALCLTAEMAELARQHNDANVLALGARLIDLDTAKECVETFMNTKFEDGRHEARVKALGQVFE